MPRQIGDKFEFIVHLARGNLRKRCYTYAVSKEQAKRYCKYRNPGYRVTQVKQP